MVGRSRSRSLRQFIATTSKKTVPLGGQGEEGAISVEWCHAKHVYRHNPNITQTDEEMEQRIIAALDSVSL